MMDEVHEFMSDKQRLFGNDKIFKQIKAGTYDFNKLEFRKMTF